jgi:hypothetical protein
MPTATRCSPSSPPTDPLVPRRLRPPPAPSAAVAVRFSGSDRDGVRPARGITGRPVMLRRFVPEKCAVVMPARRSPAPSPSRCPRARSRCLRAPPPPAAPPTCHVPLTTGHVPPTADHVPISAVPGPLKQPKVGHGAGGACETESQGYRVWVSHKPHRRHPPGRLCAIPNRLGRGLWNSYRRQ